MPIRSQLILFFSVIVYLTAAYFNIGYYYADEHYQLIEFAGIKLGWNEPGDLAWEFGLMMRPTLQVWICVAWIRVMGIFGIDDPYTLAFSLRLLTAFFALVSIRIFFQYSKQLFKPSLHVAYELLSYLLWFVPVVSVRFSSETWSGLCFLIATGQVLNPHGTEKKYYLTGLFMGLAFLFRFQTGILTLSILLWWTIVNGEKLGKLLITTITMAITIQVGVILDALFYGKYVFSFWNYFKVTILQDSAPDFGTSPWTTIFSYVLQHPLWPIGVIIVVSILFLLYRKPNHVLLWCLLPFLVIHALIPHKEVRFLFPVVYLISPVVLTAVQEANTTIKWPRTVWMKMLILMAVILLVLLNLIALTFCALRPAGKGDKHLSKYVVDCYGDKPIKLFHSRFGNPFQPWPDLKEHFYRRDHIVYQQIDDPHELAKVEFVGDTVYLLTFRMAEVPSFLPAINYLGKWNAKFETQSIPAWMVRSSKWYIGAEDWRYLQLYRLDHLTDENE